MPKPPAISPDFFTWTVATPKLPKSHSCFEAVELQATFADSSVLDLLLHPDVEWSFDKVVVFLTKNGSNMFKPLFWIPDFERSWTSGLSISMESPRPPRFNSYPICCKEERKTYGRRWKLLGLSGVSGAHWGHVPLAPTVTKVPAAASVL